MTPLDSLEPVYRPRRPLRGLDEREKFEICLGALLTQNTSWTNVVKVFSILNSKRLLSFDSLKKIPLRRLEPLLRSSGYFRQKARRVKNFLSVVKRDFGGRVGNLFQGSLPAARNRLLVIDGVGPETADSMLLYAGARATFVVDAYTRRIGLRWGLLRSERYDDVQRIFMAALPRSAAVYGEYHALIVELAKRHCRTKPLCAACPLKRVCATGKKFN